MDSLNANVPSSAASRPDGDPPTRVLLVMEPGGLRDQLARIARTPDLSRDTAEMVGRILGD